ncbi:GIY-YIG nuclease family protein [Patescibacteria group bacterium]|nr:GIY-YIG nuclease family protein [Patescibacteria group bacterium]
MHCVYLLKSIKNHDLYIGCTSNIKQRLAMHNQNKAYHTKKYGPWKLIYCECFISKKDAYQREKSLKLHAQGLRRLKERLRNTLMA